MDNQQQSSCDPGECVLAVLTILEAVIYGERKWIGEHPIDKPEIQSVLA